MKRPKAVSQDKDLKMGVVRKIYLVISTLIVRVTRYSYARECRRQEDCAKNRDK